MTSRVICASLFLAVAGCAAAEHEFPALHPVSGIVQVGGKPASGGLVQLQSSSLGESMLLVQGIVNPNGEFELSTTSAKIKKKLPGAPAGTYKLIFHPASSEQQVMPVDGPGNQVVEEKENRWTIVLRP